jgi:hypothetical protein
MSPFSTQNSLIVKAALSAMTVKTIAAMRVGLRNIELIISMRGILRRFGLKVGAVTRKSFEIRVRQLMEGQSSPLRARYFAVISAGTAASSFAKFRQIDPHPAQHDAELAREGDDRPLGSAAFDDVQRPVSRDFVGSRPTSVSLPGGSVASGRRNALLALLSDRRVHK